MYYNRPGRAYAHVASVMAAWKHAQNLLEGILQRHVRTAFDRRRLDEVVHEVFSVLQRVEELHETLLPPIAFRVDFDPSTRTLGVKLLLDDREFGTETMMNNEGWQEVAVRDVVARLQDEPWMDWEFQLPGADEWHPWNEKFLTLEYQYRCKREE